MELNINQNRDFLAVFLKPSFKQFKFARLELSTFWSPPLLRTIALIISLAGWVGFSILQPEVSQAKHTTVVERTSTHPGAVAEDNCQGEKNQSVLKVKLRVWEGKLRIDKGLSRGAFEPSDLFKCRVQLEGNEKKRQGFEKELLDDLDSALLKLPRFYLYSLTLTDLADLITYLSAGERAEFVPFMSKTEKVRLFAYLPEDEQLLVISDLNLDKKKQFFAYLPADVKERVLEGLSEDEKTALRAKKKEDPPQTAAPVNDAKRVAVAQYPGSGKKSKDAGNWKGFLDALAAWQAIESSPVSTVKALDSFLTNSPLNNKLFDTAILGFDNAFDTVSGEDAGLGQMSLRVTDPIGDLSNSDTYRIVVPPKLSGITDAEYITPPAEKIISLLRPLKGQLWKRQRIASYINDYFIRDRTGYEREPLDTSDPILKNGLDVSIARDEPKCIIVRPIPQFTRILFIGELKDSDIRSALRELLTDSQLKVYRENSKILTKCKDKPDVQEGGQGATTGAGEGVSIPCQQISFEDLSEARTLPYLNLYNWRLEQAALAQAGFLSSLKSFEQKPAGPPASENEAPPEGSADEHSGEADDDEDCEKVVPLFVEIKIIKSDKSAESILSKSEASPTPTPTPTATVGQSPTPGPSPSPTPTPLPTPTPPATNADAQRRKPGIQKPKRNMIGGDVVYRPDQGFRLGGQYTHFRPGQDDFSVSLGGDDGGLLVSGDYEGVDLFRGLFEHEFPFLVRSYSDSVANRLFNRVKLDERRSGAAFQVTTKLKSKPTLLSLSFGARHETVALADSTSVISKQDVSSLTFGATYSSSSKGARYRRVWQLEPTVRFGLGISKQPSFSIWQLKGRLRQILPGQFDLVFDGRLDVASKRTPIFEQPSFGSSETVRGFRSDDAIGLRQWTLKNEFVMPVPGTAPDSTGLAKALREMLKLAAFVDIGGIYKTTGSTPGLRFGPGVGLRVNYKGADFLLDWAFGLGDTVGGRGRGRFYFSVSREIPKLIRQ